MKSMHNRKFVTSSVALVLGRIKNVNLILSIRDYLESLIVIYNFLNHAPFLWIGLTFLYGIKNNLSLQFEKINKKYGDLGVALELDMEILQWADKNNLDLLHDIFMIAALEALIQVGQKYELPTDVFIQERAKYGNIPNTIEECESYSSKRL